MVDNALSNKNKRKENRLEYSDYRLRFYSYIHKFLTNASFCFLQIYVELVSLHGILEGGVIVV